MCTLIRLYLKTLLFPLGRKYKDFKDLSCGSAGKESTCNAGDLGLIPGLGRSSGEGKGYPLQCSGLKNCIVHGVAKSQTKLRYFHVKTFNSIYLSYF